MTPAKTNSLGDYSVNWTNWAISRMPRGGFCDARVRESNSRNDEAEVRLRRGLHKRGGVWWISYQKDGQQVRESSGYSNERAASRYREKRISEVYAGTWQPAVTTAPRLSVFTEKFLSCVSNPTTRDRYRCSLNNLIEYLHDPILSNISTAQLYQYQVDGLKAGKSPATLNRDNAALRRLHSFGKKRGLITILRNPCSDVEPLNETATRRSGHPFTRQEEARITSTASGWFLMLFILLIETGLRVRKEALSLRWDDVDLDSEPGRIVIRSSKTAAGVRTVFLTDYCRNALRQWKTIAGPALSDFVFPNPNNPSTHIKDYKGQWKSIAKKAGIVGHKFYDTRSTFATRVNACAQSILTVAQLLGHKGTSVSVLPAYVRPLDENTRSILNSLDAARAAANKTPVVQ